MVRINCKITCISLKQFDYSYILVDTTNICIVNVLNWRETQHVNIYICDYNYLGIHQNINGIRRNKVSQTIILALSGVWQSSSLCWTLCFIILLEDFLIEHIIKLVSHTNTKLVGVYISKWNTLIFPKNTSQIYLFCDSLSLMNHEQVIEHVDSWERSQERSWSKYWIRRVFTHYVKFHFQ